MQPPYGLAVAISDRQDGSLEILAGPLLQGPAWGGGRSGAGGAEMRYQEGEQASDRDTGEYSGSSSEEVGAPVSMSTKRYYTRQ